MTGLSRFRVAGALVATVGAGVIGVWLTGDARAFGTVIALAGLVVGVALGRQEWRTSHSHRDGDLARHAPGDTNSSKAA